MSDVRICVADPHQVVIEGTKSLLRRQMNLDVSGEALTGERILAALRSSPFNVIVTSAAMPDLAGRELMKRIRLVDPLVRIILFSSYADNPMKLMSNVAAVVFKESPVSDLVQAMENVLRGGSFTSPLPLSVIRRSGSIGYDCGNCGIHLEILSRREQEVFKLLAEGYPVREIAGRLGKSPKTVETQKYRIMEKLAVRTVTDLTKIAVMKKVINM